MKAEELRNLSLEELRDKIEDLRGELFNLRFQKATGQIENPLQIRLTRRAIARALTILREKELQGEKERVG
jgi:large subunit ribosomal protein L29